MTQEHFTRLDLKVKYDQLMIQHGVLVSKYKELWREYSSLKAQHEVLVRDHNWLTDKQKSLNERYDQFLKEYYDLQRRHGDAVKALKEVFGLVGEISNLVGGIVGPDKSKASQIKETNTKENEGTVSHAYPNFPT